MMSMMGPIGPMEFMVIFLIGMVLCLGMAILLVVWPFWLICKKAGFPGALALLMLIPIGNIILPFILAFSDWPSQREGPGETYAPQQDEYEPQRY